MKVQLQHSYSEVPNRRCAPDLALVSRSPHALEPNANNPRIVNRVLGVAVPEVILDQPQVMGRDNHCNAKLR